MLKVSVITVCFNSSSTIECTLKSVQNQSYPYIEHILIDGGSTDNTNSIIEKYSSSVSMHICEPDNGLYDAMNKGIHLATGDIVGILNSDDVFSSCDSLHRLVDSFNDSVDGVYSDLVYVDKRDLNKPTRFYSSKHFNKHLIRFGLMLPHPTLYLRKSCYEKYGYYRTDYRSAADFELITRFICRNIRLKRVDFISIKMREGGVSSNGLYWRIHQNFEIVKACKTNGIYTNIFLVMLKLPYKLSSLLYRYLTKDF